MFSEMNDTRRKKRKTNLEMMFAVNKMFHKMYTQNIW